MPIYEYQCPDCGARYEQLVGLTSPTPACPGCGGANARKLVSAAGFILKGSGWYRDHYGLRSGGGAAEPSASAPSPAPAASPAPSPTAAGGTSGSGSGSAA